MRGFVAVLALIAAIAGCGKEPPPPIVPAEGVVLLDGKPLNKVAVRFVPPIDYGAEYIATGVTDEAGRFTLTCKGQPGACVGENQVIVTEADIPSRLQSENAQAELAKYLDSLGGRPLPPRYANLMESPLTIQVRADQTGYVLTLQR